MGEASTIGLDIAKRVFQAHGADASGRVVFRKRLSRAKLLEFFAAQPPCIVAMEACGGSHPLRRHWRRSLRDRIDSCAVDGPASLASWDMRCG